jgi:hypothetical protein
MAEEKPIDPRLVDATNRRAKWLLAAGWAATAVGVVWLLLRLGFVLTGVPATGVVDVVEQRSDSSQWHARFSYGDLEGRRHTAEMSFLSPSLCPSIRAGNSVPVRYSAADPDDALIVTWATLWFGPGMVLAGGVFCLVVGRVFRFVAGLTAKEIARRNA